MSKTKTAKAKQFHWDSFSATMTVERADGYEPKSIEEFASACQYLIDTGLAWSLQGYFGRTCSAMIERGDCHR
jgi:hypothetical protein